MKFNKLGRNTLAAGLSLTMGLGLVACSRDYVPAYVYAPSAVNGAISAFAVDYQSGILNQVAGSPFASNVGNATTVIATPNGKFLFEIGGSQNAVVESFGIGTDGKLYGNKTYTLALNDTYPTGAAVDSGGNFLYVTYRYQANYGPTAPGPGGVNVFKINSDGTLGTPTDVHVGNNPVGIAVTVPVSGYGNNVFAYVLDQETAPNATLLTFSVNTTTGALTQTGSIHAGVVPSFVIAEPTGRYVYVSDQSANQVIGYQIVSATGTLQALPSSPYSTGLYPVSMTIDPRGKFLYTANYNANTVSGFTINHADGSLGGVATSTFTSATGPTCVTVDPSVGIYLYTSNYLDGSISGARLTTEDGSLTAVANTPFPASSLPACVTSVANGSHASSLVNPN